MQAPYPIILPFAIQTRRQKHKNVNLGALAPLKVTVRVLPKNDLCYTPKI
jgi:hypothetical protein